MKQQWATKRPPTEADALHNPPELTRLGNRSLKGVGPKFADLNGGDVRINPTASEHQVRAVGPLSIRQHEVRSRFGDDYLFAVELDLDVHDEIYHEKWAPAEADAPPWL
jgi:hypothetical protein